MRKWLNRKYVIDCEKRNMNDDLRATTNGIASNQVRVSGKGINAARDAILALATGNGNETKRLTTALGHIWLITARDIPADLYDRLAGITSCCETTTPNGRRERFEIWASTASWRNRRRTSQDLVELCLEIERRHTIRSYQIKSEEGLAP